MSAPIVLLPAEIAEINAMYAGYTIDQSDLTQQNWAMIRFTSTQRSIRVIRNMDNTVTVKQMFVPVIFKLP